MEKAVGREAHYAITLQTTKYSWESG
ncbi:hypothetical protein CCACVL1_07110, partial [Corchorus capsularis]